MTGFSLTDDIKEAIRFKSEDYPEIASKYIIPLYRQSNEIVDAIAREGEDKDAISFNPFYAFQDILIAAIYVDLAMDRPEYEIYVRFCQMCVYDPLSPKECLKIAQSIRDEQGFPIMNAVKFLKSIRGLAKDSAAYHYFLIALWCLTLANETITEREYRFVYTFYNSEIDDLPSSFLEAKELVSH